MVTYDTSRTAAPFLKHHTAVQHQALEAVVLPRLQELKSLLHYTHLLQQFYGFFKPMEDQITRLLDERDLPDLPKRRKADLILEDLSFSKAHLANLPLAEIIPCLNTKSAAFGALYVLEGSTLGGRGITRLLLKNEHLKLSEQQVRFFNGYGDQTGKMWTAFLERLNNQGNHPLALAQMATAANATFTFFKTWLLTSDGT